MSRSSRSELSHAAARPIIVGYAFGPKKMETMMSVMAEASKAKIDSSGVGLSTTPATYRSVHSATSTTPDNYYETNDDSWTRQMSTTVSNSSSRGDNNTLATERSAARGAVVLTLDGYDNDGADFQTIVRYFQSSSVAGGSESTGTITASTTSNNTNTNNGTMRSSSLGTLEQPKQTAIRVSFVPLDLEQPLEDQHDGKMDVILHKLTEDILAVSQMSSKDNQQLQQLDPAVIRIQRLTDFCQRHPCCLVDDPLCVQTLMNRSDIARTLRDCLAQVTTVSGMKVSTPKWAVVEDGTSQWRESVWALEFPIIVKPLVAAGTKASHAMAVVMDPSRLECVVSKAPCLCQEYSNHDALLYKVYVLGDFVSVYKRRSVPNLPKDCKSKLTYVEFDSQRPYPRLVDFGFEDPSRKRPRDSFPLPPPPKDVVTVEEIQPVVKALKNAFGLELFGFDVLISSAAASGTRQMLVVDVNYFPSYKEVPNFPALLAKHLTDRAIQSRRQAVTST